MRSKLLTFFLLGGTVIVLAHCSSIDDPCEDPSACQVQPSPEGGTEGGGDTGTVDACVTTPTAEGCVTEEAALFVSGGGGDDVTGDGTRGKPYRTLGMALGKLSDAKKRIYVCEGIYLEDVRLTSAHAGLLVAGGLTCAWAASPNRPVFGKSPLALKVEGATDVTFRDVEFHAVDATTPSESSIAAFVVGSKVTFTGVTLQAGSATVKGAAGTRTDFILPAAAALKGNSGDSGGSEKVVTCPDGSVTKGGKGGASNGGAGESGTPGLPNFGSIAACSDDNKGGGIGQAGSSPEAGAGAQGVGELGGSGWHPESGVPGMNGGPGQGGGGGAGLGGGTGGGGGAGGCGGAGGSGGGGGGGSIALASFQSTVTFVSSRLVAAKAAPGGDGAEGQKGSPQGGDRGVAATTGTACNGGNGGRGGDGASGGGGAGGVSVGVLYKGMAPALDTDTKETIVIGANGTGGNGGGSSGKAGINGQAAPVLEIK